MQGTYGNGRLVTVFGGTGFLGRHVVRALTTRGYRVRAAVRRPERGGYLRPLGMVGQVEPVQANVRFPDSVGAAMEGAVAVVNLVGIACERRRQTFAAVHEAGARLIGELAAAEGIATLVHVSTLAADPGSNSPFLRSKGRGEAAVLAAFPAATLVRPGPLFGPGDHFFNRFANLTRLGPVVQVPGAATKVQPVYAGDVAEAIGRAVDGAIPAARLYEFGGAEVLTIRQCVELMLADIGRRRLVMNLPFGIARPVGWLLERLPGRLLTVDQVRQLRHDFVVSADAVAEGRTLAGIGIHPTSLAAILPTYLYRFRPHGQFARPRDAAG